MKIFLIRHGETTGDIEQRYGGSYDDSLTKKGEEQALSLAARLKGKGIIRIFHSPFRRSEETARILNGALGAALEPVDELRERNTYGILSGMRKTKALERYPSEVKKLYAHRYLHDVDGSESYDQFRIRVMKGFKHILGSGVESAAVISHGGVISCLMREFLKAGEVKKVGDCSFIELFYNGGFTLMQLDGVEL